MPDGALVPDYSGIRPKIHGPDEPQPDFRIDGPEAHGLGGLVVLLGIESPGLTSSLAIGEEVAGRLGATPMQVALAWLLRRSPNILLIPGTSSVAHLRENLAAGDLEMPADAMARLDRIAAEGAQA